MESSSSLSSQPAGTRKTSGSNDTGLTRSLSMVSSACSLSSNDPFDDDEVISSNKSNAPYFSSSPRNQSNQSLHVSTPTSPSDLSPRSPGSATQSPPAQTMERPNASSSYRIPSSVFARTKSNAPVEWSTASNESLFSIHTGNMSFTRDYAFLAGELETYKSGELFSVHSRSGDLINVVGEPSTPDTPAARSQSSDLSNDKQHPLYSNVGTGSNEVSARNSNFSPGLGATEAAAAKMMKEVIRENELNRLEVKTPSAKKSSSSRHSQVSDESGGSNKSFAFPILTRNASKRDSVRVNPYHQSKHHPKKQEDPPQESETPDAKRQAPSPEKGKDAAPAAAKTGWLSCFSCCSGPICS